MKFDRSDKFDLRYYGRKWRFEVYDTNWASKQLCV